MRQVISNYVKEDKRFQELDQVFGQDNILVTGLSPSAKATIIAEKYLADQKQMLLVTNNLYQADKIEADILQYVSGEEIYKYPVQDIMTEEFSTQSPQLMSERVRTLTALAHGEKGLFIVPLNGLKKWLTPVEMWRNHQMTLNVGDDIDVDDFLNKLVNMGYRRESVVSHIGEFSLRGGIIDIYPLIGDPVRIELFDTEIDSIRDLQYVSGEEIYKYPVQDIMTEEFSTQSPQLMSERVRTLTALAHGEKGLFIVPLNGLKKWLTPVEMWRNHQMTLNVGDDIDVDDFLNKLVNMGYRRESVVSHIGEFSLRGGIIDIYPLIGDPVRIELFDTEIDSIRDFDVETQRSNDNLESVEITAASDYIITDEVINHLQTQLKTAYEDTRPKIEKSVRNDLKETYESFKLFESTFFDHQLLRRLVAFMYDQPSTIIDYFANDVVIAVDEYNRIKETEETLTTEVDDFINNLIESGNGFIGQSFMQYDGFETLLEERPVAL